ncbi:MAG TPA: SDR family NAD(P)-dependent oxidoreductase [Solirubrobacteraceae bacterium]|nr:SDR family NAD(P)-dependent oxidoreductase [Solirubrobacteraceae bacterium]
MARVAVVTGAGHGIGRASALALGRAGARLALVDLRAEAGQETRDLAAAEGIEAMCWQADVSKEEQVHRCIEGIVEHYGRIDIVHSNAGVLYAGTVLSQTIEEWDHTYAVNVRSMFLVARAVIPAMKAGGGGSIITTASISGMIGEPNLVAYNSSKGAVINLTRQLAVEWGRHGIRVNAICPGWIETGFNDPVLGHMTEEELAAMVDTWIPLGRQGTAEDIAPSVVFLASDDAAYISGSLLVIDGGLTAQ